MAAKIIALSTDDITYHTLPGNTGEISRESAAIDDTIFGQTYRSNFPGIITWSVTANAVYKGYAGYQATIKKVGTSTAMTDEATTLVSGKTYQITNAAKRIINRTVNVVVEDNAVDHTADVESIDYLFGKVTFKSAYTVTGPVTVTGEYYPTVALGTAQSYTLTQSAEPIDTTDFATASSNGGYKTHDPGLRTVSLELSGVYSDSNAFPALLLNRTEVVIEVNPDGAAKSLARGFFRLTSARQSGNVGALEEDNLTFSLNVPLADSGEPTIAIPFGWEHANDSTIPQAIRLALDAFLNETTVWVRYYPKGIGSGLDYEKGEVVVSNFTMTGSMEAMNTFAFTGQGDGVLTVVNP